MSHAIGHLIRKDNGISAEDNDGRLSICPWPKRSNFLVSSSPHRQCVDRLHELPVAAVLTRRNGCIGIVKPIQSPVCASDESVQTGCNENGCYC